MNPAPIPWLPPAQNGDVERAVAAFVVPWAQAWFKRPGAAVVKRHPGRSGEDFHWSGSAGATVGVAGAARAKLGLTLVVGQADLANARDRKVLERLADAAIEDLAGRLGEHRRGDPDAGNDAGPVQPADASPVLHLALGEDGWSLLLSLGSQVQTVLRMAASGQGRAPSLTNLRDALAPQSVTIGCHLGSATLTASDLAELARGDLITLDRRITDDLPLTVAETVASSGTAKLVDDGTGAVVRITQAINSNPVT